MYTVIAMLVYLATVRRLRFRRAASHTALLHSAPLATMSIATAQQIYTSLFNCEFPFIFMKGIQLALFRTYAIPTISTVLARSTLLSNPTTVPKRYSDTEALFIEFALRDWGSDLWLQGMARTKAIHTSYRKTGKVTNADMLYTIAAIATQPSTFVAAWEWRDLTDIERCAIGVLYRGISDALDIPWEESLRPFAPPASLTTPASALSANIDNTTTDPSLFKPPHTLPPSSWSGLTFYHALSAWQLSYEHSYMTPHPANHQLAVSAVDLLLWTVPTAPLKNLARSILTTIMDPPLRTAMSFSTPPQPISALTAVALRTRAFVLRHLSLPRPEWLRVKRTWSSDDEDSKERREKPGFACPFPSASSSPASESLTGSPLPHPNHPNPSLNPSPVFLNSYAAAPYYVRPTLWNRWLSPLAWIRRIQGLPVPGDGNNQFYPKGYVPTELGPRGLGHGVGEQSRAEREVWESSFGGGDVRLG